MVLRNDPNTSMESNKSYCSVRDATASSSDKSEESCTSAEESARETNVPPVETQNFNYIVPFMCGTTTVVNVNKEITEKIVTAVAKKSSVTEESKTGFKTAKPVEKTKEKGQYGQRYTNKQKGSQEFSLIHSLFLW